MISGIPLPGAPAGSFQEGMKNANELSKQVMENRIKKVESQYAPYTQYANALSKIAYGQTAPATALAQILASPAAANMDQGLYNQLATQANNSLKSFNTGFIPNPQGMGNGFPGNIVGGAGNMLGALMSKLLPQSMNPFNQTQGNAQVPGQVQNQSGTSSPVQVQGQGQTPGYNTQFSNQAGAQVPGSMGANNPTAINAANTAALHTTATGQAQNQNELQVKRSAAISAQSAAALQALKSLDGFERNYDKSSYKGQFIGEKAENIPTLPGGNVSPEQLANRYANQYLIDITALGDTPAGRTDEGRALIASAKFGLSLDPGAKKEIVQSTREKLKRVLNLRNFSNNFYRNNPGATDEELVGMMNAYNRYAPSYDYENGIALPENDKKFKDFTSREALNSYRENGDYNPYPQKMETKNDKVGVQKVFDLTGFNGDADFQKWLSTQSPSTKKQVRAQIMAGIY